MGSFIQSVALDDDVVSHRVRVIATHEALSPVSSRLFYLTCMNEHDRNVLPVDGIHDVSLRRN